MRLEVAWTCTQYGIVQSLVRQSFLCHTHHYHCYTRGTITTTTSTIPVPRQRPLLLLTFATAATTTTTTIIRLTAEIQYDWRFKLVQVPAQAETHGRLVGSEPKPKPLTCDSSPRHCQTLRLSLAVAENLCCGMPRGLINSGPQCCRLYRSREEFSEVLFGESFFLKRALESFVLH